MAKRIKCTTCHGRGERAKINWGLAAVTLGIGIIIDLGMPETCKVCDGKGYLLTGTGGEG